jgi:hypothetical protein
LTQTLKVFRVRILHVRPTCLSSMNLITS